MHRLQARSYLTVTVSENTAATVYYGPEIVDSSPRLRAGGTHMMMPLVLRETAIYTIVPLGIDALWASPQAIGLEWPLSVTKEV